MKHTQNADETQLYVTLNDVNVASSLPDCFSAVQHWLDLNGLSMNPDKTDTIAIGITTVGRSAAHTAEPFADVTALYCCDVMVHDVVETQTASVMRCRMIMLPMSVKLFT